MGVWPERNWEEEEEEEEGKEEEEEEGKEEREMGSFPLSYRIFLSSLVGTCVGHFVCVRVCKESFHSRGSCVRCRRPPPPPPSSAAIVGRRPTEQGFV